MAMSPYCGRDVDRFVISREDGALLGSSSNEHGEETFEWMEPGAHLCEAREFDRGDVIGWLVRAGTDPDAIPPLRKGQKARPELHTLQAHLVRVSRQVRPLDGVGPAAAFLGVSSKLSAKELAVLGVSNRDRGNLESLLPLNGAEVGATKAERSVALQYRDEQVAKTVQKVEAAFSAAQPTGLEVDEAFTTEMFLAKNGLPDGPSGEAVSMIVCSALASFGLTKLAKAVRESYRFSTRVTGEPEAPRVNSARLCQATSELLKEGAHGINAHSWVRRVLNKLTPTLG